MKKRLLVIEDQAPMRRNIALLLELEGYEVIVADNGRSGLEMARQHRPDLVLCDVMMPEMDGYSVVQAMRSEEELAATPFVFLTAKSDRGDVRVGMNFGADDYLTKPVVRDDLLAAVQVRLSRAETHEKQVAAAAGNGAFNPDFSNHAPLAKALSLTPREAEVLLWVAQGKSNGDVASILDMSEKTVKQHLGSVFQKIGVESRTAASLRAVEVLSGPR
jgi:DNA-binding NarL/FixJ family response regulator